MKRKFSTTVILSVIVAALLCGMAFATFNSGTLNYSDGTLSYTSDNSSGPACTSVSGAADLAAALSHLFGGSCTDDSNLSGITVSGKIPDGGAAPALVIPTNRDVTVTDASGTFSSIYVEGKLALNGSTTVTGDITVKSGGALDAATITKVGGNITVEFGGVLNITDDTTVTGTITNNGTITLAAGKALSDANAGMSPTNYQVSLNKVWPSATDSVKLPTLTDINWGSLWGRWTLDGANANIASTGGHVAVLTGDTGASYGFLLKDGTVNCNPDTSFKFVKVEGGTVDLAGANVKNDGTTYNEGRGVWISGGTLTGTAEEHYTNEIQGAAAGVYVEGADSTVTGFYNYNVSVTGGTGSALQVVNSSATGAAFNNCAFTNSAADNTDPIVKVTGGSVSLTGGKIEPTADTQTNIALYINESAADNKANVTLDGVSVKSYNPDNAIYVDDAYDNTLKGTAADGKYSLTLTGGTGVNAKACTSGVHVRAGGSVLMNGNAVIDAAAYGIKLDGNEYGTGPSTNGTYAKMAGGTVNVDTAAADEAYGVYATGADCMFQMDAGNINATAMANSDTAFGVYAYTGATANIEGGAVSVEPVSDAISSARLEGVRNDAGTVNIRGGVITLDAKGNNNNIFGLFNKNEAEVSGGEIVVKGGGDGSARGIQNQGNTKFTGGRLTMTGNGNYGVYNVSGLFEMGAHGQTEVAANAGEATHPYIYTTNAHNSYGVYNTDGSAKIYAGTIDITSTGSVGVYVDKGNVQVLANEHKTPIAPSANIVVNVTVNGTGGEAFAVAGGNWAIRGRGSLFTANTALNVTDSASNDGGFWRGDDCTGNTNEAKPLSGGSFVGEMKVGGGKVSGLLLQNHYLRDDTGNAFSPLEPSDGERFVSADSASVGGRTSQLTVTDAEWELRYALELDNDINNYKLPIDITLDAAYDVHGTGAEDSDVDVTAGKHVLDLSDKTLSYDGADNAVTTEPDPAVPSVIEVSTDSTLTTVAGGRDASKEDPFATKGVIKFGNTHNGVAVHVNGGSYYNGSLYDFDAEEKTDDGAILKGTNNDNAASCNLRIDDGEALLFSGMVGWEDSSNTSVLVNDGQLNVFGGEIYGNTANGTGVLAAGGKTLVLGGTIHGDLQGDGSHTAIELDTTASSGLPEVIIDAQLKHDIQQVIVTKGYFDLQPGSYVPAEGETPAGGFASTIEALFVDGENGSAYVHGGVIREDSSVTAGDMLADGGVFEKDLEISGTGEAFFAKYINGDVGEDQDPIVTYCTVKGTLSVANAGDLRVQYGDFNTVTTDTDGTNIDLHGGLYGTISTTYTDSDHTAVSDGEYIGGFTAASPSEKGMIPANHYLAEQGNPDKLCRTDKKSESAGAGKKMELLPVDFEKLLSQPNVKLPCFIDLNADAECEPLTATFRTDKNTGFTVDETEVTIDCGIAAPGTWVIEDGNHTLDLNGYDITNSGTNAGVIDISGGSLTILDSSAGKDGRVVDDETVIKITGGRLALQSGAVYLDADYAYEYAIKITGGELNVSGGSIYGGSSSNGGAVLEEDGDDVTITVSGGNIEAAGDGIYCDGGSVDLTVTGGTVKSTGDNSEYCGVYFAPYNSSKLNISGGAFENAGGPAVYIVYGDASISGGTFGKDSKAGLFIDDTAGTVNLTGGAYKSIIVEENDASRTLGTVIGSGVTVTAEQAKPLETPYIVVDEDSIDPTPASDKLDEVKNALRNAAPNPTVPISIPREKYGDKVKLSDDDYIKFDYAVKGVSAVVGGTTYTGTVTQTFDYKPMFTLSTGGFNPGPVVPTPPLETKDHFAYMKGYPDGSFRPEGTLTRAEAAVMFYRLLTDQTLSKTTSFSDLTTEFWAYNEIQVLADKGIIVGYPDGTFNPDGTITRAEFCAMSSRFFKLTDGKISFVDVPEGFWAHDYIASAAGKGWITTDETYFRPDDAITRAEAVTIVNAMLGREADKSYVDTNLTGKYPDVAKTHSAYYEIMEASIGHNYTKSGDKETWTGLK